MCEICIMKKGINTDFIVDEQVSYDMAGCVTQKLFLGFKVGPEKFMCCTSKVKRATKL